MIDIWDDDWERIIQGIIDSSFAGAYVPRRKPTDYGSEEEGVLYAGRELEILDFDGYITITMYLQGVRDEELEVKPEESAIIISYMLDGIWKRKPLRLPIKVKPDTAKISFNNFVLDIKLEKVKE